MNMQTQSEITKLVEERKAVMWQRFTELHEKPKMSREEFDEYRRLRRALIGIAKAVRI